jgi:N-acetylneuraminic acid mutarotase
LCSTSKSRFWQDRHLVTNRIRRTAATLLFLGCLVTLTSAFNLPNRSPDLSSQLASLGMAVKPAQQRARLTLADRVTYQRAIEEVYWRHRIWPKERPDLKPSLDEVMPSAQLEKKVEDYLRSSQALEDYWQQSLSAEQLQAEMERMAQHTKQPEVLRELFDALGSDPFVIAECLARPALAERLTADLSAQGRIVRFESAARIKGLHSMPITTALGNSAYTLPRISGGDPPCTDDTWTATTIINAPDARGRHTAVWTGSEMIVWGGVVPPFTYFNSGGRYTPATDSWTATSTTNAPTARFGHTAVWTGSEMIVWGGYDGNFVVNTGGRYNPNTDSWTATSTTNAPSARSDHTAVWTGSEMIVWGGFGGDSGDVNTGGRYNPNTDSWTSTSTTNAPTARESHTAVWTGSEMIVWGGSSNGNVNTGGRYDPSTDSWTSTSTTNAPIGRIFHTAVWAGSEMIVWGGSDGGFTYYNTGGRYNPSTDSWTATSITNATQRSFHTAVWTGSEMIVWGGGTTPGVFTNTGERYNHGTDTWTPTSITNAPEGRSEHTAVWTGTEMIAWGGQDGARLNTGGRYCAQPSTPIVQSAVSQKTHGNAGSFSVNLPLIGTPGIECRSGGATNDYTMVVTFLANVSVTGNPQAAVTSGIGIVGTGGVSNGGTVTIANNVVTVPLTNVANAQTINLTLYAVNGSTNIVIPMSVLIGDTTANGVVNAGDVSQTKSQVGQAVTMSNFREDVNANGLINSVDVALVKSKVGTALP